MDAENNELLDEVKKMDDTDTVLKAKDVEDGTVEEDEEEEEDSEDEEDEEEGVGESESTETDFNSSEGVTVGGEQPLRESEMENWKAAADLEARFSHYQERLFDEQLRTLEGREAAVKCGDDAHLAAHLAQLAEGMRKRVDLADVEMEKALDEVRVEVDAAAAASKREMDERLQHGRLRIRQRLLGQLRELERESKIGEMKWSAKLTGARRGTGLSKGGGRGRGLDVITGPYLVLQAGDMDIDNDMREIAGNIARLTHPQL